MANQFVVVTNCTARKRTGVPVVRFNPRWAKQGLSHAVERWNATLAAQAEVMPAGRLYVGRSICEARTAAHGISAELFVVSAGLGLVSSERPVPAYDLSAAAGESGLSPILETLGVRATDWWHALTARHGLRWLLKHQPQSVVLLALPADYLTLISGEFGDMTAAEISRLRVFTSESGRRAVADIDPQLPVMPYDDRLESIGGFAGTRSDFPQRALRHFTDRLAAHTLPVDAAINEVRRALSAYERRSPPQRRRLDDEQIRSLIRKGWDACRGNSAHLLRYLRDREQVACEQGRFAELRRSVQRELSQPTAATEQGASP